MSNFFAHPPAIQPKIHHNPQSSSSITPPPCHPPCHILASRQHIHSKYAGHLHGKEGLPGPLRRIDDGGSVPLRPVRATCRRVIVISGPSPTPPAPAAAHPPGIRQRHRQARLPVGQAADAAHLQDRADRSGLRHHRCVLVFVFVVEGMQNYARHNNTHALEWDVSTAPGIWHSDCLYAPFNACSTCV